MNEDVDYELMSKQLIGRPVFATGDFGQSPKCTGLYFGTIKAVRYTHGWPGGDGVQEMPHGISLEIAIGDGTEMKKKK